MVPVTGQLRRWRIVYTRSTPTQEDMDCTASGVAIPRLQRSDLLAATVDEAVALARINLTRTLMGYRTQVYPPTIVAVKPWVRLAA